MSLTEPRPDVPTVGPAGESRGEAIRTQGLIQRPGETLGVLVPLERRDPVAH